MSETCEDVEDANGPNWDLVEEGRVSPVDGQAVHLVVW